MMNGGKKGRRDNVKSKQRKDDDRWKMGEEVCEQEQKTKEI